MQSDMLGKCRSRTRIQIRERKGTGTNLNSAIPILTPFAIL